MHTPNTRFESDALPFRCAPGHGAAQAERLPSNNFGTLQMDKIELTCRILDRQLAWISAADSRIALIVPLSTAMLGALAAIAPGRTDWSVTGGIAASFAVTFLFLSLLFCAFTSFPRTSGPRGSLVYFGGITSKDSDSYVDELLSSETDNLQRDFALQCHINAEIAEKKFSWIKRAMGCLLISIIPWAYTVYIVYQA